MRPNPRTALVRRQRRWAATAGVEIDTRGFLHQLDANFRAPLSDAAQRGFTRGSELRPRATSPPRMQAVFSSAALVANFFDYWVARDCTPLLAALELRASAAELLFEHALPTGLEGDPPLSDLALVLDTGSTVAIESKFGEWLPRRPRRASAFKDKYFAKPVWADNGLPAAQALATDFQSGVVRFKHLHAAQLLKHALGLERNATASKVLLYLYYDWPGTEARMHAEEIAQFAARIDAKIGFRAATYQAIFAALRKRSDVAPDYLAYLEGRYFPAPHP